MEQQHEAQWGATTNREATGFGDGRGVSVGSVRRMAAQSIDIIDVARFWSKVNVGRVSQCWEWRDAKNARGYGEFKVAGVSHAAHRIAAIMALGDLPQDVVIRHTCDNPSCCNPHHLLPGTHADNVADRVARDRSARGERNGRSKVTEEMVRAIRADCRSNTEIARELGMTDSAVSHIRTGRSWGHVK